MATAREYAYYMEGNRVAIVEKDYILTDGLNYTHSEGDGLGLNTGNAQWKSPTVTVSDALQIEYTVLPKAKDGSAITDESDDIDIQPYLAKALVYYIKAKFAEDQMDIDAKEYFMKEFRKMIEKNEGGRFNGYRHAVAGSHAIR
tara:strand:+ start:2954 stop:3385 length:432 start_codon:yes stop_codon:yes gene_type:complete